MQELKLYIDLEEASAIQATKMWTALAALRHLTELTIYLRSEPDIDFCQHLSLLKDLRYDCTI